MARRPPGKTIEARERELVNLAVDLAEQQLRDGTAAPSVINHYLRLGTTSYQFEKEKLQNENMLLKARVDAINRQEYSEDLYQEAIDAMRRYSGNYDQSDEML